MGEHPVNDVCEANFKSLEEKIKVLFKSQEAYNEFFKNTSAILARLEIITAQQEKWIQKKDIVDEKRDSLLQDISETLRDIKTDQSHANRTIEELKIESNKHRDDNSVKISVIIKNLLFFALGALVAGIIKSYLASNGIV